MNIKINIILFMSILEIAKLASVSHTTVARVINNEGKVKPQTADRIRKIIKQIGYTPKPVHLRPGPHRKQENGLRTGNVAFLASSRGIRISSESPIMIEIMHAISDELVNSGMSMIQGALDKNRPLSPLVARGEVDGILVFNDLSCTDMATREFLRQYPVVYLMTGEDDVPGDRICPDNTAIGQLAAEYLIRKGCKDILYFTPRKNNPISMWSSRWDMFNTVASRNGVRVREVIIETGEHDSSLNSPSVKEKINEFVLEYFVRNPAPDGLFVAYDVVTAILYPILQRHGIKIGEKLHMISCNNEVSLLAGLEPKPARIDLQPKLIGKYAVDQLIERMQNPDGQKHLVIRVQPLLIE